MVVDGTTLQVLNLPRVQAKLGISTGGSVPDTREVATVAPLSGGGDLKTNRSLSIPKATSLVAGYLSAADFAAFAAKESVLTFTPPVTRIGNVISWTGDTDDVPEGASNLYWTAARFNAAFAGKSTTDLAEGTNLYFTDARARAAFSATAPILYDNTTGVISLDLTAIWTHTANGIGATATDRVILSNTTAAAAGAQQYSPALRLTGQGWATTSGTSRAVDFRAYVQPVQGTGNPSATLLIDFAVNGGAFTNIFSLASAGDLSAGTIASTIGNVASAARIVAASTSTIGWNGSSRFTSPSDGVIEMSNAAVNGFTRLQFGGTTSSFPALRRTSAQLDCVLADNSALAAFSALSLTTGAPSGGTAGVWKLGIKAAATVALDTANYVQLDIGGTAIKLAIVT